MNEELSEAIERWQNSDGFASCDEHECFEMVYRIASAYMAKIEKPNKAKTVKRSGPGSFLNTIGSSGKTRKPRRFAGRNGN